MAQHLHYNDTTGDFLGFYSDRTNSAIPSPSIELTDEAYDDYLKNSDLRQIDVITKTIITIDLVIDLNEEKEQANRRIDNVAENARLRYITGGAGQAMIYQEKAKQADAYAAAGYPVVTTDYPMIQSEANATGTNTTAAADGIIAARNTWLIVGAEIEEARLTGKAGVSAATTVTAITTSKDDAVTELEAI